MDEGEWAGGLRLPELVITQSFCRRNGRDTQESVRKRCQQPLRDEREHCAQNG